MAQYTRDGASPDFVAGGGLLSRRLLLKGAVVGTGAAAAGLSTASQTAAEPVIPDWVKISGERARGYGMPAESEASVTRAIIEPWADVAPAFSLSGTPHHRLRGTITPSGLHFEVHHAATDGRGTQTHS